MKKSNKHTEELIKGKAVAESNLSRSTIYKSYATDTLHNDTKPAKPKTRIYRHTSVRYTTRKSND
jgi:hypothetical protein